VRIASDVYDWRLNLDQDATLRLWKCGVHAGQIQGRNGRLKGAIFRFTFTGDRERVKADITDILVDKFGATDIQFWAEPSNPRNCYATFDMNMRWEKVHEG